MTNFQSSPLPMLASVARNNAANRASGRATSLRGKSALGRKGQASSAAEPLAPAKAGTPQVAVWQPRSGKGCQVPFPRYWACFLSFLRSGKILPQYLNTRPLPPYSIAQHICHLRPHQPDILAASALNSDRSRFPLQCRRNSLKRVPDTLLPFLCTGQIPRRASHPPNTLVDR